MPLITHKFLKDRAVLELIGYPVDSILRENRPNAVQDEYVLKIDSPKTKANTPPYASWHIPFDRYERLYHSIRTTEDFEKVWALLVNVRAPDDLRSIDDFLTEQRK